jgi:hypothetical protein
MRVVGMVDAGHDDLEAADNSLTPSRSRPRASASDQPSVAGVVMMLGSALATRLNTTVSTRRG